MHIAIMLAENNNAPKKIQLLRTGDWKYSNYGKGFKITKDTLVTFKKNFDEGVRGYEDKKLPIDYFHENWSVAAGWMEELTIEADGNELWASVKWTPTAEKMLQDGEIRYVSVEFDFKYRDDETGKEFGPTLFGAGLTNRPFVKGMDAVAAAEDRRNKIKTLNGGNMDLEQAQARIKELEGALEQKTQAIEGVQKEIADLKAEKLAETKRLAEEKLAADKTLAFNTMLGAFKVIEAQREAFMLGDMIKFTELAKPLNTKSAGTEGDTKDSTDGEKSAQDQIIELAKKLATDTKVSLAKAQGIVLLENPELAKKYEQETTVQ